MKGPNVGSPMIGVLKPIVGLITGVFVGTGVELGTAVAVGVGVGVAVEVGDGVAVNVGVGVGVGVRVAVGVEVDVAVAVGTSVAVGVGRHAGEFGLSTYTATTLLSPFMVTNPGLSEAEPSTPIQLSNT